MVTIARSFAHFIFHIPHASRSFPPGIRESLDLNDSALGRELLAMTDAGADSLFLPCRKPGDRTVLFQWSRLVADVERFRDDRDEIMSKRGMGAVYTMTHDGRMLRAPGLDREGILSTYYDPHHSHLESTVRETLEAHGSAFILDCHTFPTRPLPCDLDQRSDRPDVCLGTDPVHTPRWAVEALASTFRGEGFRVATDRPYAGTIVPLAYLNRNPEVSSIMIELRRGLFLDETTGLWRAEARKVGSVLYAAVEELRREYDQKYDDRGLKIW